MSQAGILNIAGGGGGGSPVQTLTGNSGGAVSPTANNINILGDDSTVNNANGITVIGTPGTSTETVTITNRLQGSGTTVNAGTTALATMNLGATPGNYAWEFYVSGFEPTGPSGAAYNIMSSIRTTGVAATLIGTSDETYVEDAALGASDIQVVVSGNSVTVNAIGILGLTIDWNVVGTYVFIG